MHSHPSGECDLFVGHFTRTIVIADLFFFRFVCVLKKSCAGLTVTVVVDANTAVKCFVYLCM